MDHGFHCDSYTKNKAEHFLLNPQRLKSIETGTLLSPQSRQKAFRGSRNPPTQSGGKGETPTKKAIIAQIKSFTALPVGAKNQMGNQLGKPVGSTPLRASASR
jgi:hypothetical protein